MSSKMKKWASLLLVFVLALGFIPPFAPEKAQASPSFFYPDDPNLANVANLNVTAGLTPSVAYLSKQRNINITGTFNGVNSDSLNVTVEQMYKDTTGWHPDTTRKFTKGITTQSNKFEVTNLQLFTGYNKVTFKGTQSGVDKYDVYYVLYEDVPYIKSLKIGANSEEPIDLNEGASVVFKKPAGADVNFKMLSYIQGVAANSTKVTVGKSVVSPTDDGAFFAPPQELKPGRNDITILIGNESNTIELKRTVYYYDDKNPFISVLMNHESAETGELINNTPTLTAGTNGVASTAAFTVNMLVPYSSAAFTGTVTADVYNNASPQNLVLGSVSKEETIYGRNGQPDLENVTFTVSGYNIPAAASGANKIDLNVAYAGQTYSTPVLNYNIYRGSVQIKNIKMLPDYPPSSGTYDMNKAINLNNAEYSKPEFYIEVETDKDLSLVETVQASPKLGALLLPYNSTNIIVELITVVPAAATTQKMIYKISNLPTGTSQLRFQYNGSLSGFVANVNYVSQKYISVDNLYDGQTIEVDSSILTGGNIAPILISGELKNFENPDPIQMTVNGKSIPVPLTANKFTDVALRFTSDMSEDYNLDGVKDAGPLYFGENLIRIKVNDQAAVNHLVTKEIRIYIMDKNMPKILKLQPAEIPIDLTRTILDNNTFNAPFKQFRYVDNKYVSSLKKFDFVFSGSGAENIKVKRNGELLLEISGTGAVIINNLQTPEKYSIPDATHFNGDEKLFYVRLKDLQMLNPGTQTYEITLRNKTGATVTQSVTIQREVSDFVIWSPVPTVGNRVVVNKNFVLFDIEAEGAESILIDGKAATPRADLKDRFTYNYIGLKAEKEQSIKVSIVRDGKTVTNTVKVLYTTTVQPGSMYMTKMGAKLSAFNSQLNLTFPKGTILKTANPNLLLSKQPQYYDQTNLLFGIAEPELGIVERVNDYGQNVGTSDWRTPNGTGSIVIDPYLSGQFSYTGSRNHFTMVSPIFWISGGLGENQLTKKQATDGITPYSVEGTFTKYEQDRKLVPTERGELTLQFNKNVVDAAGPTVTVFHFNDKGEWTRVGGVVNTKNNTITVPFYDFGYYVVAKLREGYTDLTRHGWARNILETLYAKGYMENARTDEFGAEDYITRGEFTTLLIRALEMPLNYEGENTFYDVYPNTNMLWQYEQIETAARNGIVAGKDDRYFGVNERITRGQAATIIARALKLKTPLNDEKLAQQLSNTFTDGALMVKNNHYYAMPSISAVVKAGYMDGIANQLLEGQKKATVRFEVDANMTRAQAGAIMVRILKDYSKVLPKNFDEGFDS